MRTRFISRTRGIGYAVLAVGAIGLFLRQGAFPASSAESYISEVDSSSQPFGLYLPEPFDPDVPHPVVFYGHGGGGRASSSFGDVERSYADEKGWILVNLDARGDAPFYEGVSEKDLFEVLGELREQYRIEENRLYFTGVSLGGLGAFRLGLRHPDLFAAVCGTDGPSDYRWYRRQWFAKVSDPTYVEPSREPLLESGSPIDIAQNGKNLSLFIIVDTNDAVVSPGQGRGLHMRLDDLGYTHSYREYPGGHLDGYDRAAIYEFFSQQVNKPSPNDVVLKANELKYGSAYWVRIDRLGKSAQFATIRANAMGGKQGDRVAVTASGLLQYTLSLTPDLVGKDQVSVYTDLQLTYSGPAEEITVSASLDEAGNIVGWSANDTLPRGLRKTAHIEGPIGHAYVSKFLLVRGTIGLEEDTERNRSEAEKFAGEWNSRMNADISSATDASITEQDMVTSNLILFGTSDSNSVTKAINDLLPVHIGRESIVAGAKAYSGSNYGLYMIFPNPLNPDKYVVISHGTIQGSYEDDLVGLPWYWPDYVVFDTTIRPSTMVRHSLARGQPYYLPDAWVEAGFFDQYWRLDSDEDGMDDIFEKDVIDADAEDEIAGIEDVNPGDDFDGDGQDNRTEHNAATDPTSADSLFSIASVSPDPADVANFQVSWKVASGRSYCVLWSDCTDGPWHEIKELNPDDVSDNGDARTWTDKGNDPAMGGKMPGDCAARFYKVMAFR